VRHQVRTAVAVSVTATVTVAAGATVGGVPAAAAPGPTVYPTLTCVQPSTNGTYRAVFGYHGKAGDTTIAVGPDNTMSPATLNGLQPTHFRPGNNKAVFATPAVPNSQTVSWTILGQTVTARSSNTACGPNVSLPAEGNGIGPVLVIVASVLLSLASLVYRQWRQRRRVA